MFSKFFIDHPRFAMVLSLFLVLAGLISLTQLPVADYPQITPPTLYVSCNYTGASAESVVKTVAMTLEDAINGVDDLLYYSSTSSNAGAYTCSVTFQSGTNDDMALVNLQNAIKRAEPKLPAEVKLTGVDVSKRGSDAIGMFAFTTDGTVMNEAQLNSYINANVKDAVARVEGVSSAEVMSAHEYSLRIWLDPIRMAGLGIGIDAINSAVAAQNLEAAVGSIGTEDANKYINYKINVKGRLLTAEEFGNIIVRKDDDGSLVHMRDIANVEIGASSYSGRASFNGQECVGLAVYRTPEANAVSTSQKVIEELDKWQTRMPKGVHYAVVYNPTEFVEASITEIVVTLVSALALVVLITYLFLQDYRATLVPAIAIPISLLGTFPFMLMLGYSINILTMFGLILVIGSLVDDAIVVVENTQTLMEREKLSPHDAAVKSMKQITGAIIATTLVTVACYVPLAFYGGMIGAMYIQFAVTMCISLCISTVVALTLSPALCALILRPPSEKPPLIFAPFNGMIAGVRKVYLFIVRFLSRRAILTLLCLGGAAYAAFICYDRIPGAFLPEEDQGALIFNVELPQGAAQSRTFAVMEELRALTKDIPGIESCMAVTGMSMAGGGGENTGMGFFKLKPWKDRSTPDLHVDAIKKRIDACAATIAAARITTMKPPAIMGLGGFGGLTFELCGIGDVSPSELAQNCAQICAQLSASPLTTYAMSMYNANNPQLYLDIDRDKAELLGLSANTIFSTLQSKLASYYINDFTYDGRNYKVQVQSREEFRSSVNDINEIQIMNKSGEMVNLSSIATLRYTTGPAAITRFNKMTNAEINVAAAAGVSSGDLIDHIESLKLPENYQLEWTGIGYQEKQNEGRIVFLLGLSFLFAYLFLVAQYESWTIPISVILSVIFAVGGALAGLLVMKTDMSIYAQLGLVMLIGLAGKNAILMVEFSKQERERGCSIFEAAVNGGNLRFRAVLMTAWSFLFGVFPLLIATGAGASARNAIGLTTFAGMLVATFVGILFVPPLYAAFQRMREFIRPMKNVEKAPQETP